MIDLNTWARKVIGIAALSMFRVEVERFARGQWITPARLRELVELGEADLTPIDRGARIEFVIAFDGVTRVLGTADRETLGAAIDQLLGSAGGGDAGPDL